MRLAACGVGLILLCSPPAWAISIGLFADAGCTSDHLCIADSSGATFTVAVFGTPADCIDCIAATEFRIVGLPPGWVAEPTYPANATTILGDPFGDGVDIGFNPMPGGDCVQLLRIRIRPLQVAASAELSVVAHLRPFSPDLACPNLYIWPLDGRWCAEGGTLRVNGTGCTVGVAPITWSGLRQLYE